MLGFPYVPVEPSYELRTNLESALPLDAALEFTDLMRNEPTEVANIQKLADVLDKHVQWEGEDLFFFAEVFQQLKIPMNDVDDLRRAFEETVKELRSIGLYQKGRFEDMKKFCFALNDLLLEAYRPRRRGLAA